LTVRAQEILSELGLADITLPPSAVSLQGLHWAAGPLQALLPLPGWKALSREGLDAALIVAAIQAGAAFLPETLARPGAVSGDIRLVHLQRGPAEMQVRAKIILAADGLGGSFLAAARKVPVTAGARIGAGVVAPLAPTFYEPGLVYMACGMSGYLGLVRLEDGRLDLAAALERDWVRRQGGPGRAAAQLLAGVGWPAIPALTELPWRGTPALTRQAATLGAERVLLLGDAAGYVEPFTGEGITWALLSALAVVPVALRGVQQWTPDLISAWAWRHHQTLARRQGLCRLVARTLRQPSLVRAILTLLTWLPALSSPVVRYIGTGHY
jgi:flavin-dependent dehydrogenase